LFHIQYDGTLVDETGFTVLGGDSEPIRERLAAAFDETNDLAAAIRVAIGALAGPDRTLGSDQLELAILDRSGPRRTFRRIEDGELDPLLG
jgi:proteasome alpha subunit